MGNLMIVKEKNSTLLHGKQVSEAWSENKYNFLEVSFYINIM